jgi:hypothetical protein
VIDRDHDDGQSAEKIEAGLAFTIGETRVDCYFGSRVVNGEKLSAMKLKKKNPLPTVERSAVGKS